MGELTSNGDRDTRTAGELGELLLPATAPRHEYPGIVILWGLGFRCRVRRAGVGISAAWAYREKRARREAAEATGKTARTTRTWTEGRALRVASSRLRDGFWYTENLSRALPAPCWDPIAAAAVTCLREAMRGAVRLRRADSEQAI